MEKGSYLLPHAALELGLTYMILEKKDDARHWIEKSREFPKFLMEALLHLKAHSALRQLSDSTKSSLTISEGS